MDNKPTYSKEFTLEELRASNRIIYSVVSGSIAYGTNVPESDIDLRGYYWVPPEDYVSLFDIQPQIDDDKHDTCYYNLKRAFDLLKTANPNQIELLWVPSDCIKICAYPVMDEMLANRKLFISKETYNTHASYAAMQIKKAKGSNKKVHNPQPKTMPSKEDFCWVIETGDLGNVPIQFVNQDIIPFGGRQEFPFRPIPVKVTGINLDHVHVSSLEHAPNVYRMYYYGEKAKGVFRGDQMLCCESIPKEDEQNRFIGLLIYNKSEFDKALKDWHSYWDWMKNRNDARWVDQEKGLVDFDAKNMMHCVRLMISAENILTCGEPLVRFEGDMLKYLMSIRRGEITYDKIMEDVETREARLKDLFEKSTVIPDVVDINVLNEFYQYLISVGMQMKL